MHLFSLKRTKRGKDSSPNAAAARFQRETIILFALFGLGIAFGITTWASRSYHAKQEQLAADWYKKGETNLQAGRPSASIEDFRTALVYFRGNTLYQLRLAQALIEGGRETEARAYLTSLWDREPGDATVNLALGRLAMREGDVTNAVRYFHNAIYGVWESNTEQRRRQARLELAEFLLDKGRTSQAQAELLTLAGNLPQNAALHNQVGHMFLMTQDYNSALSEFRKALKINRHVTGALAGAGEAAFKMANYREAQRYLDIAFREEPHNSNVVHLLQVTNLVLAANPFEPRLLPAERRRRVIRDFKQSFQRLQECAQTRGETLDVPTPVTDLQSSYAQAKKLQPQAKLSTLRRKPKIEETLMNLVFLIEEQTAQECGPPTGLDEALLLIARKHASSEP